MTTNKRIDTELHEDDVRVMRHRIERDYGTSEIPADAFQEMEIEIPLRGEEVDVRKHPVIREHVVVSKVLRERGRTAIQTLRREELNIHGDYIDDELQDVRLDRSRSGRSL